MRINDKPMIATPRVFAFCLALLALAGCGLKGPLYLPPPEPVEGEQPASDPTAQPKSVSLKKAQGQNQPGSQTAPPQTSTPKAASQLKQAPTPAQ
jgi:predicted small lipoprotein YifL